MASNRPRGASGGGGSFLAESAQDVPANAAALSFADPGVTRPVNLQEEQRAQNTQADPWKPSILLRMMLVALCLYCAPAVALFQQHYKESMKAGGSDACNVLWDKVVAGFDGAPAPAKATTREPAKEPAKATTQATATATTTEPAAVTTRTPAKAPPTTAPTAEHAPEGNLTNAVVRRLGSAGYVASGDWQVALDGFFGVRMTKVSKETAGDDGMYFDEALQHKECVWYLVETGRASRGSFMWRDKEQQHCGKSSVSSRAACEAKPGCAFFEEGEAPAGEASAGCYFSDCVSTDSVTCYKRVIHSYDKGFSLFMQSMFALLVHWLWAYLAGGHDMLMSCFDTSKMSRFAIIGFLFGFSSVFGFLGQSKLTPGSYLIVGQSSIIIVPVLWRLIFRTAIPVLSWVHIFMTAVGIYMYFLADMEGGDSGEDSVIGILYAFTKVSMSAIAAVNSDKYLKTLKDIPFPVQVAYVLPFKAAACLATCVILPPHRFPPAQYRPGGAFHDMNLIVVVILIHSLGDTVISGVVVNVFDAVAKALIAVCGIIFPTWVVSYILGWDKVDWGTDSGKLKVSGAVVVVAMAFAYVLGRSQAKELSSKADRVAELEQMQQQQERYSGSANIELGTRKEDGASA